MADPAPDPLAFERQIAAEFRALIATGPLTSVPRAVLAAAQQRWGNPAVCWLPAVVDDYLQGQCDTWRPVLRLPGLVAVLALYFDENQRDPILREGLDFVVPLLAIVNPRFGPHLARFPSPLRESLTLRMKAPTFTLTSQEWPGYCAARRKRLLSVQLDDATVPHLQWLYFWDEALGLANDLLSHPGQYRGPGGHAVVLLPGDRRSLPLLQSADTASEGAPEKFLATIDAAIYTESKRSAEEMIRHVIISRTLELNRVETVAAYLAQKDSPLTAWEQVDKRLTRLMSRIRELIPGFDWPKKPRRRRPPG